MITNEEYTARVLARASTDFHQKFPSLMLASIMTDFINTSRCLDVAKKAIFYGKVQEHDQEQIDRFIENNPIPDVILNTPRCLGLVNVEGDVPLVITEKQAQLFHAIIGLCTEAGELLEAFINGMATAQQGNAAVEDAFDNINMNEEFGDALWYIALGLDAVGSNLNTCMTINDRKLEARYGPTFSSERANERDLDAERTILEDKDGNT